MKKTIEGNQKSVKNLKLRPALDMRHVWSGEFFPGIDRGSAVDAELHDKALRASASRLVYHAHTELRSDENATRAAIMLREAALLLDVLRERQSAREVAP